MVGALAWTWRGSSRIGGLHGLLWAPGIGCARHDKDTVVAGVRSPLALKSIEQASRPRTTERDQEGRRKIADQELDDGRLLV
jgi:hypothetical protein